MSPSKQVAFTKDYFQSKYVPYVITKSWLNSVAVCFLQDLKNILINKDFAQLNLKFFFIQSFLKMGSEEMEVNGIKL